MKCLKDNEIQTVLYSRTTQCPFNDFQRGLIPPNDFFYETTLWDSFGITSKDSSVVFEVTYHNS